MNILFTKGELCPPVDFKGFDVDDYFYILGGKQAKDLLDRK